VTGYGGAGEGRSHIEEGKAIEVNRSYLCSQKDSRGAEAAPTFFRIRARRG
jgi:hypothetical protein